MPKLRHADIRLLDELFDMGGGYVLGFSNKTLAEFFDDSLQIDIYDERYAGDGPSKANRVRCFLKTVDAAHAVRALRALWDARKDYRERSPQPEKLANAEGRFLELLNRLQEQHPGLSTLVGIAPPLIFDVARLQSLRAELYELYKLDPQPRGYAFEKWLAAFAAAYQMTPRASFRLTGEQIDGSFALHHETYLLEAKWQSQKCDAADLRAFNAKVEDKAHWSRGLFLSYYGFSDDGLAAFGRGKRIICMDGGDLWDLLGQGLPFDEVLARKVRAAAETGKPFVRVRELFAGKFDEPVRR